MYTTVKRAGDFFLSSLLLLVCLPIFIPLAIALRFTGEGEIFYLQKRVGYQNQSFHIWKLATMLKDSPNMEGGILTRANDPRMTPLGPFLRKSKLNELPQLVNIWKGDMSFVGPRPVMKESFENYPEEIQAEIYSVKPGLTGVGSIIFRNEEELISQAGKEGRDVWALYTQEIYPYKGELERWYQKNQSFLLDVKIILLTAYMVFFPNSKLPFMLFKGLPRWSAIHE